MNHILINWLFNWSHCWTKSIENLQNVFNIENSNIPLRWIIVKRARVKRELEFNENFEANH